MGKTKAITDNATAKPRVSKVTTLLEDPEVKRWYDNLARGSPLTAEMRSRRLYMFCKIHDLTPAQLADLGTKNPRAATNLLEDHVTMMEERKYSPGYAGSYVTAIKSWFAHFDVHIHRRIKIRNADSTPTLKDERVPDHKEMAEIFARASLRSSAIISLMSKAGLRPEVIGNHDGADGLRMRDLPDIMIRDGTAECVRIPNRIVVRAELSKTRHQYFTFLTSSGTKKLTAYLNDRMAAGEVLNPDSAVIAPNSKYRTYRGRNTGKPCLATRQISKEVRSTFRPRFKWRPYVLRAYFDTQLLIAESKGRIAHDFRVFFMGHKGSMEARYTTNKGMLPEVLVREMCEAFRRSEEFLDLELQVSDPLEDQKQGMHEAIRGATPEQLGHMLKMIQDLNIGKMSQVSSG